MALSDTVKGWAKEIGAAGAKKKALAKKIKNPERGHEERHWKRMSSEGDRTANDYR